jgi:hypothetical protein
MNKQKVLVRAIPAVLACLASGYAAASGFQLFEQNASGIGNSYAGSAAVAENASTVFYNPAGMTQLEGKNISAGVSAIHTSYKFTNGASTGTNNLLAFGNGNDAGGTGYVPNGYFTMPVAKDLYFGLGIGAPFGLQTDYRDPWMGASQSIKFEVKTVNINPSIAYRANDTVSRFGPRLAEAQRQIQTSGRHAHQFPDACRCSGHSCRNAALNERDHQRAGYQRQHLGLERRRAVQSLARHQSRHFISVGNEVHRNGDGFDDRGWHGRRHSRLGPPQQRHWGSVGECQSRRQASRYLDFQRDAEAERPMGDARRSVLDGLEFDSQD